MFCLLHPIVLLCSWSWHGTNSSCIKGNSIFIGKGEKCKIGEGCVKIWVSHFKGVKHFYQRNLVVWAKDWVENNLIHSQAFDANRTSVKFFHLLHSHTWAYINIYVCPNMHHYRSLHATPGMLPISITHNNLCTVQQSIVLLKFVTLKIQHRIYFYEVMK